MLNYNSAIICIVGCDELNFVDFSTEFVTLERPMKFVLGFSKLIICMLLYMYMYVSLSLLSLSL